MEEKTKKVLIVEDDKDFLWLLRQGFENQGLVMLHAFNGEEGLAMAEKEKPDLIIADIKLPNMDGVAMVKKVREKNIPCQVIFLTNFNDPDYVGEAMNAAKENADYFVKSDVKMEDIVGRVKNKLGLK